MINVNDLLDMVIEITKKMKYYLIIVILNLKWKLRKNIFRVMTKNTLIALSINKSTQVLIT